MIVGIRAFQDKGKTALAIGTILELCAKHGYSYDEVVANLHLKIPVEPGPHSLNNLQMRSFVRSMVSKGLKHKIVLLDEADRLFPARFWSQKEQTDALIGLWQDYKLFNYIIYTAHEGTSVDIVLRQVTQIELNPMYDEKNDCIPFVVYNAVDGFVDVDVLDRVSKNIFPYYDRWEVIN